MPTAKLVEEMTDAGEFELLATRVLRQLDVDYLRVEHMGVNASGKTVKNPLDGFCRIPGSQPPRYVMAAFSTDMLERIERKLLFDHSTSGGKSYTKADDGDLVKANRLAKKIREEVPNAELVFTFCTNKQPKAELMQKGYVAGEAIGIEVRFLARSSIRDHLDTTPEGQWLRKEHLGIAADTLSISLLKEISQKSIEQYAHELFCFDFQIVETATIKQLAKSLSHNQPNFHVVVGGSGTGKSVSCYQVLADAIDQGSIGLWIPAEIIATSYSFDAAILNAMKLTHPTLEAGAGHEFLALASQAKVPFILVIDDLNRTKDAAQQARKIMSWQVRLISGESAEDCSDRSRPVTHVIVPIWSQHWSSNAGKFSNTTGVGVINALPFSTEEARECLQLSSNGVFDYETTSHLARRLEHDPILIGLWCKLYGNNPNEHLDAEASELIENYVSNAIEEDSSNTRFLAADIRETIKILSARILRERDLYPTWESVTDWLSDSQLAVIRHVVVSEKVCRVVQRGGIDRFEFRHDRLLESALTKPLSECLAEVGENLDVLSDPFFVETIARSLISANDPRLIATLQEHAPLAILAAIRYLTDCETDLAQAIANSSKEWLEKANRDEAVPSELIYAAAQILETIENELVLHVTDTVKHDRKFAGARLVNGDAIHGKFFVASNNFGFFPNSTAFFIENLVDRAFSLHGEVLCNELAHDLRKPQHSDLELHAALTLAGYFGTPLLAPAVLSAWRQDSSNRCLVESLWASMRCSDAPLVTLSSMLDSWATLPNDSGPNNRSERSQVVSNLKFCMRHGLPEPVIEFLVSRAERDERLSGCLDSLLKRIDHPSAVVHVAKQVAKIDRRIEGRNHFSHWAMDYRRYWDPLEYSSSRLSDTSRNALLALWEDSGEEWLKKSVLRTWMYTTESAEEFSSLPLDAATSDTAIWRRVRLSDRSVQEEVLKRLVDGRIWFQFVAAIWSDIFIEPLDNALEQLARKTPREFSEGDSDDHYVLAEVLRDIPRKTAEQLMLKHWDSLKYSPNFNQASLYIGSEILLATVAKAMQNAPDDWNPFEHIGFLFGLNTVGLRDLLTDRHIDALLPYIGQLSDIDVMAIAEWLEERRRQDVLRDCVTIEIKRRVSEQISKGDESYIVRLNRKNFPSDSDLLSELSKAESEEWRVRSWCLYSESRGDSPERIRHVLRKWFSEQPSVKRLLIAAKVVQTLGQRDDATWLLECQEIHGGESTKRGVEGAVFSVRRNTLS